ncbi:uncharacterized protein LAESUDRAFT_381567 [Laetiporus sulphureus 93-53]|uniref:Secreted protein n=1 Tax=Laetiporus sulphureus 93-53 TaxID=1314785 RepID=A0A165CLR1_9APHY|nr:uncharacterized protein LAESUDRAFT_381567 [Laetiporus sulphureus 93-53]KZT03036.1 hypothetical protein LAESUDRAFT_381567 [Laetiporus sulphureus 93-53]
MCTISCILYWLICLCDTVFCTRIFVVGGQLARSAINALVMRSLACQCSVQCLHTSLQSLISLSGLSVAYSPKSPPLWVVGDLRTTFMRRFAESHTCSTLCRY